MTGATQITYQRVNQDPVIHALAIMNGKWDALAVVKINGQDQLKVFTLFQRFITLFTHTHDERAKIFDAQAVANTINSRLREGGLDFTPEQGTKIAENLALLNQRLGKKQVNLNAAINVFTRVSTVQSAQEIGETSQPVVPAEWNLQTFNAILKSFNQKLKPYIVLEDGRWNMGPNFYFLEGDDVSEMLEEALTLFREGSQFVNVLHHAKKYTLIQKLVVFVDACEEFPVHQISADPVYRMSSKRRALWSYVKTLAETLPDTYAAEKQMIKTKTI